MCIGARRCHAIGHDRDTVTSRDETPCRVRVGRTKPENELPAEVVRSLLEQQGQSRTFLRTDQRIIHYLAKTDRALGGQGMAGGEHDKQTILTPEMLLQTGRHASLQGDDSQVDMPLQDVPQDRQTRVLVQLHVDQGT